MVDRELVIGTAIVVLGTAYLLWPFARIGWNRWRWWRRVREARRIERRRQRDREELLRLIEDEIRQAYQGGIVRGIVLQMARGREQQEGRRQRRKWFLIDDPGAGRN